jgi:hypothetical protein
MKINKSLAIFSGAALALSMVVTTLPAFAQGNNQGKMMGGERGPKGPGGPGMMRPGVMGKVTAVSGTTLTLNGRQMAMNASASTTFSVDASSAIVMKNNATSTLSAISIGDNIFVEGTVTGTSIVATIIHDGALGNRNWDDRKGMMGSSTPMMQGNGQPVVAGKVTAISGTNITITNLSNVIYTIDASAASISNIKVGDTILVQGAINGNSIVASSIIDQSQKRNLENNKPQSHGFFGSIGGFFSRLFGF